ncbi:MAG: transketolase, partial [Candidatus Bathyarchaeota archaeon]|nr:transketolase [Candidatus Bathyarchaeota archaeon]
TVCALPGITVVAPCDSIEVERACDELLFRYKGPKYVRFARESTPIVTNEKTPFVHGKANVVRFRGEKDNFADAFEMTLASDYKSENEDITLISCGPELCEAMRAAYILKREFDVEARVINMHTIKPLDKDTVVRAAKETGAVLSIEEHQVGGMGNRIAAAIAMDHNMVGLPVVFDMMGINDTFGESGEPWELMKFFGLSAEHIVMKADDMLVSKRKKK